MPSTSRFRIPAAEPPRLHGEVPDLLAACPAAWAAARHLGALRSAA